MRSGICSCLAVYDWSGEINVVEFHRIAKLLFDANGVSPDVGSLEASADENKVLDYPSIVAALSTGRNREARDCDFYHTLPGYKQLIFGWDVFASLISTVEKTMVFCCAQSLPSVDIGHFEEIVRRLAALVDLKYAIGYERPFELGPDLYAHGMVTGLGYSPEGMAQGDRIAAWMHERLGANRHLHGFVRDVYPLNVLSSSHVSRDVENVSLGQWIQQSADRGDLKQIGGEAWLWNLDHNQIDSVRADLQRAGCLIVPYES